MQYKSVRIHLLQIYSENEDKMRFRQRLAAFFYGRYGIDGLYYGLFTLYVVLWVVQLFFHEGIAGAVLFVLQNAALLWMLLRVMSRNHLKRRRENEAFMKVFRPVKNFFILCKNRIRDRRTHTYKRCPHCRSTLRLPKREGDGVVKCPRCRNRFTVKGRKKR